MDRRARDGAFVQRVPDGIHRTPPTCCDKKRRVLSQNLEWSLVVFKASSGVIRKPRGKSSMPSSFRVCHSMAWSDVSSLKVNSKAIRFFVKIGSKR